MRVLLVSTLRNEGPHLLEWVAHHRSIGVTDFLLYSNDCGDGTDVMLDALAPHGVVHVPNRPPKGKSLQWHALKEAWRHGLRKTADWAMCIDCDEFINLRAPLTSLADLIERMPDTDATVMPWRLFGHSGQDRLGDTLTTETFTRASPAGCDYPVGGRQFKTLLRTRGPFRQFGVHRPRLKKDATARWADGSGEPMSDAFSQAEQRINMFGLPEATRLVQLNHYSVRSTESFMLKRARGLPNRRHKPIDLTYWVERNFNTVEDASISRLIPGTRAELAGLMADPHLAELHLAAHDWHHAEFARLMRDREAVRLFGRLLLAAGSAPLSQDQISRLVQLYRAGEA